MKQIEVVAAIIHDAEGRIFATQRGYGEWKDYWEFPGGKMEPGETTGEALMREIWEELETRIKVERLMDKVATFLQQQRGLDLKEHMVDIEEMAQLNNGGYRQVKSIKLSRTACVAITLNADRKKPIVNL